MNAVQILFVNNNNRHCYQAIFIVNLLFFIAYIILLLAAIYDPRGHNLIRNFKSPIGLWGGGVVVGKNELYKPFTSPHPTFKVNL